MKKQKRTWIILVAVLLAAVMMATLVAGCAAPAANNDEPTEQKQVDPNAGEKKDSFISFANTISFANFIC